MRGIEHMHMRWTARSCFSHLKKTVNGIQQNQKTQRKKETKMEDTNTHTLGEILEFP